MNIFLQLWGGLFYLFAKVFLSYSEEKEKWRIYGWLIYLIGIPAWVIVLAQNHNWIAVAIELGGAPAMILGIIRIIKKSNSFSKIDIIIKIFVWIMIITGIIYSLYNSRGIISWSQILECGVMIGYLVGTYLLSKRNGNGWLFFALMNISMGTLMLIQGKWIFVILQIVSIYYVFMGFKKSRKNVLLINK